MGGLTGALNVKLVKLLLSRFFPAYCAGTTIGRLVDFTQAINPQPNTMVDEKWTVTDVISRRMMCWLLGFMCAAGGAILDCSANVKNVEVPEDEARPERKEVRGSNRKSERRKGRMHPDRGRERAKVFAKADVNKDGALTFEEFSAMDRLVKMQEEKCRRLFDFLDRNKDGKLHRRELQPREPDWLPPLRKQFGRLDANQNGALDMAEFLSFPHMKGKDRRMVERLFFRLDRNKNKVLERGELKRMGGLKPRPRFDFDKHDLDQSGGLDFKEYSTLPFMDRVPERRRKKLFERIDADKDGDISRAEIRAAHHRHRVLPHGEKRPRRPGYGPKHGFGGGDKRPPDERPRSGGRR